MFPISDIIHKFARDHYSKRFPELESLVPTPLEYMQTVRVSVTNVLPWDPRLEETTSLLTNFGLAALL